MTRQPLDILNRHFIQQQQIVPRVLRHYAISTSLALFLFQFSIRSSLHVLSIVLEKVSTTLIIRISFIGICQIYSD